MKIHKASFLSIGLVCLASLLSAQTDDVYYDPERQSSDIDTRYYKQNNDEAALANQDYSGKGSYYESEYADEYYYTNRIRRFNRPLNGIGYYDPYYTDLVYVDPWYNPYAANQYSRWNNWNSMNWDYYGYSPAYSSWFRPRAYFSFGFGNPWGWNSFNSCGWNSFNSCGWNPYANNFGYNGFGFGSGFGYGYNNFGYGNWNNGYGNWNNGYGNWNNDNNHQNTGVHYGPKSNGSGGMSGGNPNRSNSRNPNTGISNPNVAPGSTNSVRNTPDRSDKLPGRTNNQGNVTKGRQPSDVWNKYPSRDERYRANGAEPQRNRPSNVRPQQETRPSRSGDSGRSTTPNIRPERNTPVSTPRSEQRSERQNNNTPSQNYSSPSRSNDSGGSNRPSSPSPSRSSSGGGRRG